MLSSPGSTCLAPLHHATGPRPCSAIEHCQKNNDLATQRTPGRGTISFTQTMYGALRGCCAAPSEAFFGPGSSSQKSSASTRTRTTSPESMYMRSVSGVSRSSDAEVSGESGIQK